MYCLSKFGKGETYVRQIVRVGRTRLDNLEDMDIFGQEKKEEQAVVEAPKIEEKDLIYDKNFTCPVCGEDFSTKIMKTGKARLLGTDQDLRAKYEGIDAVKYDVILCPPLRICSIEQIFQQHYQGICQTDQREYQQQSTAAYL